MATRDYVNQIVLGDSSKLLSLLDDESVDVVITDPPYFLDKMDNTWNFEAVHSQKNQQVVTSLPAGMVFSRRQGKELYQWYSKISEEIFRVLKPGGFFFTFSSPRLYHRIASAVDDSGFEIRDAFIWLYTTSQPKAMSLNHFIRKRKDISNKEKEDLINLLEGWKTPQIKSCYEPIVIGQKPTDGTNLENMEKHKVCLINTSATTGQDMFPANVLSVDSIIDEIDKVFLISKPSKKEKGEFNTHKTVKPLELCRHLIRLTVFNKEGIVLDPFAGSGTTPLAAKLENKQFIGFELNEEYVDISKRRLEPETNKTDNEFNQTSFMY